MKYAHVVIFMFSVKPTVMLPGDRTPELTDVDTDDDDNNIEPSGDLALLTASVCESMPTDEDFPGASCSCTTPYKKGKGKGVGKGSSGSSGPPIKKNQAPTPTARPIDDGEESPNDEEEPAATQTITVKKKKKKRIHLLSSLFI